MPRRSLIIAMIASLAAGAVITAAVAVACWRWSHPEVTGDNSGYVVPVEIADIIPSEVKTEVLQRNPPEVWRVYVVLHSPGLQSRWFAKRVLYWKGTDIPKEWTYYKQHAGWPVAALQSIAVVRTGETLMIRGGVELPDSNTTELDRWPTGISPHVPIRPTIGFVIDTFIYGYICFSAFMLARMAVRARHHRKNRCPACGYQRVGLAISAPCPECGEAAAASAPSPG